MRLLKSALALSAMLLITACNEEVSKDTTDDNKITNTKKVKDTKTYYTYEVIVKNISVAQPLSPILVSSKELFKVGTSASVALEHLAEGGDNTKLLDEKSVSGLGLIKPSKSERVLFKTDIQKLSLSSMLVNTNDGFTGFSEMDMSTLGINETKTLYLNVYDAGTEQNSETSSSVAGLGGEGFNELRESSNIVTLHSGVISKDDGLESSGLNQSHKFNNPVARVKITRI